MEEEFKGLTRREFLRYCAGIAAMLGLSELYVPKIAEALKKAAAGKIPVIWMQGQACSGCIVSFINSGQPSPAEIILDKISLQFNPTVMAASGEQAIDTIREAISKAKGEYVFVVEGAIPIKEDGAYCTVGEKGGEEVIFEEWVKEVAREALAVVALGACANYGGIPAAGVTGAKGVRDILKETPVVNVAGCSIHPDWAVGTITKLILFGKKKVVEGLDNQGRPKEFFSQLIHDNCPRRHWFEAGKFLENWNDPEQESYCLLLKGCKGPVTHADCPKRKWNGGVNWCIDASHPCIGCTEPAFYKGLAPIYEKLPDISVPGIAGLEVSADTVGKVLGIATTVGIGAHLIGQVATGRLGKGDRKSQTKDKPKAKLEKEGEE